MKACNRNSEMGRSTQVKSIAPKLILSLLLFTLQALAAPDFVPGRILVKPKANVAAKEARMLFAEHEATVQDHIQQIGVRILKVPEANFDQVLNALRNNPNIEFAEPDGIHEPSLIPNDSYYSSAWHLPKIQAPQAWDITTGSSSVIIAILDTGVDSTHQDLATKIVPGWNFYDNNSDTSDVVGHGTLVAGAAAAMSNNGTRRPSAPVSSRTPSSSRTTQSSAA